VSTAVPLLNQNSGDATVHTIGREASVAIYTVSQKRVQFFWLTVYTVNVNQREDSETKIHKENEINAKKTRLYTDQMSIVVWHKKTAHGIILLTEHVASHTN